MSQTIVPRTPLLPASVKETIVWLREEATRQFINGNKRDADDRHAQADELERSHRARS